MPPCSPNTSMVWQVCMAGTHVVHGGSIHMAHWVPLERESLYCLLGAHAVQPRKGEGVLQPLATQKLDSSAIISEIRLLNNLLHLVCQLTTPLPLKKISLLLGWPTHSNTRLRCFIYYLSTAMHRTIFSNVSQFSTLPWPLT